NAHDALAQLALERGDAPAALLYARRAVALDPKFVPAHATLGDALLYGGKSKEARREFGTLIADGDPTVHHEGALREARSWLNEGRLAEAEQSLAKEAELAKKAARPADQIDAQTELARVRLDRGAFAEAGATLREAALAQAGL